MSFLNDQIPRWIKTLPDEGERSALMLLAQSSQEPFEKPREMNFILYDIEQGRVLEGIVDRVARAGWRTSLQEQANTPRTFTLTATQDEYVITEAVYTRDTSFFRRLASMYKIGYDGWFAAH